MDDTLYPPADFLQAWPSLVTSPAIRYRFWGFGGGGMQEHTKEQAPEQVQAQRALLGSFLALTKTRLRPRQWRKIFRKRRGSRAGRNASKTALEAWTICWAIEANSSLGTVDLFITWYWIKAIPSSPTYLGLSLVLYCCRWPEVSSQVTKQACNPEALGRVGAETRALVGHPSSSGWGTPPSQPSASASAQHHVPPQPTGP